jgi:hypothetical protein
LVVKVTDPVGNGLGSLYVPPQLSNQPNVTLTVIDLVIELPAPSNQELGSSVLQITLVDSSNNSITVLDAPLVVCFTPSVEKNKRQCLSYYDEKKAKWKCEDKCLTKTKDGSLCGKTDHLTNFALLLLGSSEEDPCHPKGGNGERTLSWISLGMICGAIFIVALCVIAVEIRVRVERRQIDRALTIASRSTNVL